MVTKMWYELGKDVAMEKSVSGLGSLNLGFCLEGGYHVMNEPLDFISDIQPRARELWKPTMGGLEARALEVFCQ